MRVWGLDGSMGALEEAANLLVERLRALEVAAEGFLHHDASPSGGRDGVFFQIVAYCGVCHRW